jgi:CTP:molybdopterin cytidylyltransferase MocA
MIEQQNTIIVIPARLAARRLPGKPLADIWGEPMIVHVWRRAVEAKIGHVLVAAAETCPLRTRCAPLAGTPSSPPPTCRRAPTVSPRP